MDQQIDVLIAEHEKDIRRGLRALLRFSPFINQIWEATNGESAVKLINQIEPDLVIMSVKLPGIGGLSVTRWIRRNFPDIKVIILTMYPYYEKDALAAGADRFLVKGDEEIAIQQEILALFSPQGEAKDRTSRNNDSI